MTIKYALTKTEILQSYFRSLRSSPRLLWTILLYSAGAGLLELLFTGDVFNALAWALGAFAFLPLFLFLSGKTSLRTLTASESGIYTEIGSLKGQVSWSQISDIASTSDYVLLVRGNGNAFFIPNRAFPQVGAKAQFVEQVAQWRSAAK